MESQSRKIRGEASIVMAIVLAVGQPATVSHQVIEKLIYNCIDQHKSHHLVYNVLDVVCKMGHDQPAINDMAQELAEMVQDCDYPEITALAYEIRQRNLNQFNNFTI